MNLSPYVALAPSPGLIVGGSFSPKDVGAGASFWSQKITHLPSPMSSLQHRTRAAAVAQLRQVAERTENSGTQDPAEHSCSVAKLMH